MTFVVVLDACVLVPHPLFDTLLRAADTGLYEPRWSLQILDEVERTLVDKMGVDSEKAKGRITAMQRAFPHAQVEGQEDLVDTMRNDPKDRHVLAAGVRTGAGAIVTANVKDFPATALAPYAIEALHPDDFLLTCSTSTGRRSSECSMSRPGSTSTHPCLWPSCAGTSASPFRGSPLRRSGTLTTVRCRCP